MANPFTPTQLRAALKKWFPNGGYEFYPGWETRTRPGGVAPAGFFIHHTGGSYTDSDSYMKFLFVTGRPAEGIPGPLVQFAIGGSGRLYIGSIGKANHAGSGDLQVRQKVGAENYPGYTSELDPNDNNWLSGNGQYYGVEICYPGTLPMKPAQYPTAVRLAAMIVDHYGWTALSVIAHREHSTRKIDPGKITLYNFRKDVRTLLAAGPTGTKEEEMELSDNLALSVSTQNLIGAPTATVDNALENGLIAGVMIKQELPSIKSALAGLTAAVAALSSDEDLSAEEMTNIINTAIANAVIDVDVTVKDETTP